MHNWPSNAAGWPQGWPYAAPPTEASFRAFDTGCAAPPFSFESHVVVRVLVVGLEPETYLRKRDG